MSERRLPVYLVLDTSGSMSGDPIESVKQGVRALLADLKSDPRAIETAFLSVITFNSTAQQIRPLIELSLFREPNLIASGSTAFGEALEVLTECVEREVKKTTQKQKGDWKPLIFIMSDGQPSDEWRQPAENMKQKKIGNIIALAAGTSADAEMLKHVADTVLSMGDMSPGQIQAFFKWVSASIKTTSQSVAQIMLEGSPINLPAPPPGIQIIP